MLKDDVIKHFGSSAQIAKALGISHAAVSRWNDTIPKGRAYQIEVMTGGALKAGAQSTSLPRQTI